MNPISNSQNPSLETHSDAYFRPIKLLNYLPLSSIIYQAVGIDQGYQ